MHLHQDSYLLTNDVHYLVEVKADNALDSPEVQAKREAARAWARKVSDEGDHGTWRYLLVSESAVQNSATFDALTKQQAGLVEPPSADCSQDIPSKAGLRDPRRSPGTRPREQASLCLAGGCPVAAARRHSQRHW